MEMKNLKTFSIGNIQFSEQVKESDEFFYGRMCVLSTRPNSHRLVISSEVLKRDGESVRGKWIVARPEMGDFMNHTPKEYIVGIVPENARIDFVDGEDGETYMYADAILSKVYADNLYDWFKSNPRTDVSVEMQTKETEVSGVQVVNSLNILGVTILGKFVNGSCPDAMIEITKFSENAKSYYDEMVEFSDNESGKEKDNMSETKEKDIIMNDNTPEENKEMAEPETKTEEMSEKTEEVKEEEKEEMSEPEKEEDKTEDNKEKDMSCGDNKEEMACGGDEKDMSEADKIEEDDDEEEDDAVKEDMSFCGTFKMSEFSEDKADIVKSYCEMSAKEVMDKLIEMSDELASLKKFKEEADAKEKFAKLSSIMASVKGDLTEEDYKKFSEEGNSLSVAELSGFENKVKAFAYENAKKSNKINDSGIMTFAGVESSTSENKELTADDIFNKYL